MKTCLILAMLLLVGCGNYAATPAAIQLAEKHCADYGGLASIYGVSREVIAFRCEDGTWFKVSQEDVNED